MKYETQDVVMRQLICSGIDLDVLIVAIMEVLLE